MAEQLNDDEITRLRRLLTEDDLRKLKLKYSHLMDAGRIDELADIFTEDAICSFGRFGEWHGRDEIRTNFAAVDRDHHGGVPFHAMHATTDHWVEITGPDTAIGRSYLIDLITDRPETGQPIGVIGVYDEEYREVEGAWKIARCTLHFVWPGRQLPDTLGEAFGSM